MPKFSDNKGKVVFLAFKEYLKLFCIFKDIVLGNENLTVNFVQQLTEKVFQIIIEEDPENWLIKKEVLRLFNLCQQNLKKTVRNGIVQNLNDIYL